MCRLSGLLCCRCRSLASHRFSQASFLSFLAWDSESHSSSPAETQGSGPWEGREGSWRDKGCFPSSLLLFCFLFLALLAWLCRYGCRLFALFVPFPNHQHCTTSQTPATTSGPAQPKACAPSPCSISVSWLRQKWLSNTRFSGVWILAAWATRLCN